MVSPILLELHITQEAPLPPCNFNRSYHIEDNAQLGWGETVEEGSFFIIISVNLGYFCLILKFFSMVVKDNFSKIK